MKVPVIMFHSKKEMSCPFMGKQTVKLSCLFIQYSDIAIERGMAQVDYYQLGKRNIGKMARITDRYGRVHRGRIVKVTRSHVYISPTGGRGYGYYGWYGYGYPIGLGLITGFVLGALFF